MPPFRKDPREMKDQPIEPFSAWEVVTPMSTGGISLLRGSVSGDGDFVEVLRYIDALAAGLRAAGFEAEVKLTRESVETR